MSKVLVARRRWGSCMECLFQILPGDRYVREPARAATRRSPSERAYVAHAECPLRCTGCGAPIRAGEDCVDLGGAGTLYCLGCANEQGWLP